MGYRTYQTEIAPAFLRDSTADAWHRACGDAKDDEIDRLKRALKARMPLLARPDAVAEIGAERGVERLPGESDASYAQRVVHAWESWQWAGTPYGVLVALSDLGYPGAVLVIPNGKSYRLVDGELTIEDLPTGSWSIAAAGWARFDVVLPVEMEPFPAVGEVLHSGSGSAGAISGVTGTPVGYHSIIVNVYEQGPIGEAILEVSIDGVWFLSSGFVPHGSVPLSSLVDPGSPAPETGLSVEIPPDAVFTSGDAWAFSTSFSPPDAASAAINAIRRALNKWRPGHAVPSRLVVIASGESWGWPVGTWGDAGTWGAACAIYDL